MRRLISSRRLKSSKSCLKKLGEEDSSSSFSRSSKTSRMPKNVSFHQIEIAEYHMELGDNPCAQGVPVTIGWEAHQTNVFDLQQYEAGKPESRDSYNLHMPPAIRYALIYSQGTSNVDMAAAMNEARKIQKSRMQSIKNRKWDDLHYKLEKTRRTIKKVASLTSLRSPSSLRKSISPLKCKTMLVSEEALEALDGLSC
jgi:hypothetical protein